MVNKYSVYGLIYKAKIEAMKNLFAFLGSDLHGLEGKGYGNSLLPYAYALTDDELEIAFDFLSSKARRDDSDIAESGMLLDCLDILSDEISPTTMEKLKRANAFIPK